MKNQYADQQAIEIQNSIAAGCSVLSYTALQSELDVLGYAFDKDMMFTYANTANEYSYMARAEYIVFKGTRIGFANLAGDSLRIPENHKALQALRLNTLCEHRGRVVEF